MMLPPFELERYFAQYEFSVRHLLCASDCQSMSIGELLDYNPGSRKQFESLHLTYSDPLGAHALRAEIAQQYESIDAEQVLVHTGAEEAIFLTFQAILRPGDHVVVHWPCYQSLYQVAKACGAEVSLWMANESAGWNLDVDELRRLLRPNTRLVVTNNPHNPTGAVMSPSSFRQMIELLDERKVFLFSDEVYRGLEYDEDRRLPAACDLSERAISLGVLSKSYGLAGLRIGWIALKDKSIFQDVARLKDYTTICNSAPSEFLAVLALQHGKEIVARNRKIIENNFRALADFIERRSKLFSWAPPAAGCIGFVRILSGGSEEFCKRCVEQHGILLAPSKHFGFGNEHFRIGFGRTNFAEGLAAFERAVSERAS